MTVSVHIYVQCVSSPSPPCLSMLELRNGGKRAQWSILVAILGSF